MNNKYPDVTLACGDAQLKAHNILSRLQGAGLGIGLVLLLPGLRSRTLGPYHKSVQPEKVPHSEGCKQMVGVRRKGKQFRPYFIFMQPIDNE